MRLFWIDPFKSYLGDSIYHTEDARYNSAVSWYRTLTNLGFPVTPEISRLARFIRYGVLSANDASKVLYGRLNKEQFYRYSLLCYYIDDGWVPEQDFYFKRIDWLCVDPEKVPSITLFP